MITDFLNGYMATQVMCGWASAVIKKANQAF